MRGKKSKQSKSKNDSPLNMEFSNSDKKDELVDLMMKKVNNNEKIDPNEGFKTIFLMLFSFDYEERICKLETEVKDLKENLAEKNEKIKDLELKFEKVQTLESKFLENEVEAYKTSVIVRNLGLHLNSKNGKETKHETIQRVEKLMKEGNLKDHGMKDCQRIYFNSESTAKKSKLPNLTIEFYTKNHLSNFMKSLKKIKKVPDFENINVEMQIPPSLMARYQTASNEAFNLRKRNFKTKIIIERKGQVLLLKKEQNEENFVKHEF